MNLSERIAEFRRRIGVMCETLRPPKMSIPVRATDDDVSIDNTLERLARLERAARDSLISLAHVRQRDIGAHYCRYCSAKSPDWAHHPSCLFEESRREVDHARATMTTLAAVLDENKEEP